MSLFRFDRTGSVAYEKKATTGTILNEESEFSATLALMEGGGNRVRSIKKHKFPPFPFQLHQKLIEMKSPLKNLHIRYLLTL